jgi:methylated-DNA-[protein]-cysteine S-methyltransferase
MGAMTDFERALRRTEHHRDRATAAAEAFVERAGQEGLIDVAYTTVEGPVGKLLVAGTKRGLVRVAFGENLPHDKVLLELAEDVSPRVLEAPARLDSVRRQLDEYFEGRRTSFDLKLDWRLSHGFGQRVLRHTARIPYGHVSTYKTVAAAAGSPQGARAAGNALGANPIPIVVPCHRVLHSGGGLGGYGGGVDRKEFLLTLEGVAGRWSSPQAGKPRVDLR